MDKRRIAAELQNLFGTDPGGRLSVSYTHLRAHET